MEPLLWFGLAVLAVDLGLWITEKRRKQLRKSKQEFERQLRTMRDSE